MTRGFRQKYLIHHRTVLVHGLFAIVALALGPLQFIPALRRQWPVLHRATGMVYLIAVFIASCSGFALGTIAFGGWLAESGFEFMSLAWLLTAVVALVTARLRHFEEHRRWMIRNYALTFGATMLRVDLMIFGALGVPFPLLYPMLAWLAWLPNLLVAERLCRSERRARGA